MAEIRRESKGSSIRSASSSPGRKTAKPAQRTHEYSRSVLFELLRMKQVLYFTSLRAADESTIGWLTRELNEAFVNLASIRTTTPEWFEITRADACLKSPDPITRDAAQLAFRLRRIAMNIVTTWIFPFMNAPRVELQPDQARLLNVFRPFPLGAQPPPAFLLDLLSYLDRLNLPELFAAGEMLYVQINGRFIPTENQRKLHAVLRAHGPMTKEALAERLNADPSKLYDRWGLTELRNLEYAVSGPEGYVASGELPSASSRTRESLPMDPK